MTKVLFSLMLATSLFLVACQQEIEIDLNEAEPKVVIIGEVNDQTNIQTVTIHKTVNFDAPNEYPAVKGALVTLADDAGNSEVLTEESDGIYQTQNFEGVVGRTYTLTVKSEDQTFTSQSKMPASVAFLGIRFVKQGQSFGPPQGGQSDTTYLPFPLFIDPAEAQNQYRFIQTVNGKEDKSFIVRNDNLNNGGMNQQPLFSFGVSIEKNDTLRVDMLNIDKNVYQYFYELNQTSGQGPGGGTTPANPTSNISNGAMGYFSAQSRQTQIVIAQ